MRSVRFVGRRLLLCAAWAAAAGCDMTNMAVRTQAEVMELASPVIEEQTDFEFARAAIPASLIQVEGLLRIAPDDERYLLLGAKGFASFAYGFIEDEMVAADLAGDLDRADAARARARDMYLKARGFGERLLQVRSAGFDLQSARDPDALRAELKRRFTDAEDAPALFWTGNAWGSAINVSLDDPTLIADLPFPTALVERAVELDERYYAASGHVMLGVIHASRGASMGGDPAKAREHFERALVLTERKAKMVQVNFAQSYAVQAQDRALFDSLLEEVLASAPEAGTPTALANAVARRRAERLQSQADNLILPAAPPQPSGDVSGAAPPDGGGDAPNVSTSPEESIAPAPTQ